MTTTDIEFRSLCIATDVDVLAATSEVVQCDGFVAVRTPTNPTYYWGNFLVYPEPPRAGDRARWEADFAREIAARNPGTEHVALVWDHVDGGEGAAVAEFGSVGYEVERVQALVAGPEDLRAHARASSEAIVHALDPLGDEERWAQVIQLQVENRPYRKPSGDELFREFATRRLDDLRTHFAAGRGTWYGAWMGSEIAASLGIVVTHGRARFQAVDTLERFRRQGIASRLIVEAARHAEEHFGAARFVMVAESDYHALPLYVSLGFRSAEEMVGVCWSPRTPHAGKHPTFIPAEA